jgi:hypothetical protein
MTPPLRATGSAFAAALNWTAPSPWPLVPAVMLSQFTSGWAVHWHSRAVFTASDPVPPVAGRVEAGVSTATAHLDTEEGEVLVCPDEPQASGNTERARIAVFVANLTRQPKSRRLCIFETAVFAAGEEQLLSRCLPGNMAVVPLGSGDY